MRVFHGVAIISGIKFGKKVEVKNIYFQNLRGKEILLPKQFRKLILKKINKWVNIYVSWGSIYGAYDLSEVPIEKMENPMFTVAMDDEYMVLALQHPSDTPTKKKGWAIAVGRFNRAKSGKSYMNEYGEYPNWLLHRLKL